MIQKPSKCFMSEEGGTPASAAAPAPPVTPAPTAAPMAPESPALTAEAIANIVATTVDTKIKAFENGFFANARKAGLLGKDKPVEQPQTQPTPSAPSAQAGLTGADLDARFELERVIASREGKYGLSEAQVRRLRASLSGVARDSLAAEADSYLGDMGLVKAPTPPAPATPNQPAAPAPAKPNVSDRGTAAPTDTRDHNGVLHSRPLEMTGHDVDALKIQHGEDKGLQMFQEHVLRALGNIRIKPPRG